MRVIPVLTALVATLALSVQARSEESPGDWPLCATLDEAPLDERLAACGRILAAPELPDLRRAQALAVRAEIKLRGLKNRETPADEAEAVRLSALSDLDQAIILDPSHHGARSDLLRRLGRFEEAAEGYSRAMEAEPSDTEAYLLSRSYCYEGMGQPERALLDLDAAVDLAISRSDKAQALTRRGGLRESLGETETAIEDYLEALRLVPEHAGAQIALQRLHPTK